MQVNRDRFLEEGYLIVRGAIPPDQLESVRVAYEPMVERQKTIWAQERGPEDPPGGVWELSAQPRLNISGMIDHLDAETIKKDRRDLAVRKYPWRKLGPVERTRCRGDRDDVIVQSRPRSWQGRASRMASGSVSALLRATPWISG